MSKNWVNAINSRLVSRSRTILLLVLCSVVCVLISLIKGAPTYATDSSISLTVIPTISLEMDPSVNGTFATSDTTTNNISVITDNASGYTLSLSAKTANNYDLVHDENNKLTPISTNPTDHISASTFESSTAYNNMWGIRPSKYNSMNNADYYPLSSTALVLDETSTANPSVANNYNLAVGVRATSAKEPGDYTNTITITVIANKTNYSITYNDPSVAASGMPTNTSSSTYDGTVAISSTEPIREGYSFIGWCTNSVADDAVCTGTIYAPGANWTLNPTASNSLTLYAMWSTCVPGMICYDGNGADAGEMPNQAALANTSITLQGYNYKRDGYGFLGWSTVKNPTIGTDTIYGPMEDITTPSTIATMGLTLYAVWLPKSTTYNMQNFSASTCSSQLTAIAYNSSTSTFTASAQSFIALEDTRDHDVYTIARMPDGNCWMLENLRLDESATGINTDTLSQNGSGFTISALPTSTNSFTATATDVQYNKNNTDINNSSLTASYNANNTTSKWYGYGNYYSWAAARGTTSALSSGDTTTSLCPKNWRLPIGNNSTANYSFGKLSTSMGGTSATMDTSTTPTGAVMSARIRQFPANYLYSGYWDSSSANDRGSYGRYWSSAAGTSISAYRLYVASSIVIPGTNYGPKYYGYSARCVAGT